MIKKTEKSERFKFSDIPANIRSKMYIKLIVAILLYVIAVVIYLTSKERIYLIGLLIMGTVFVSIFAYTAYLFCFNKMYYFEGDIVKIVNKTGLRRKYRDIYIKTSESMYFRMEVLKRKDEYQLGVRMRVFVVPENVHVKGENTSLVRNPIMIEILDSNYVEGESTESKESRGIHVL